jgi:hypothetical protein
MAALPLAAVVAAEARRVAAAVEGLRRVGQAEQVVEEMVMETNQPYRPGIAVLTCVSITC